MYEDEGYILVQLDGLIRIKCHPRKRITFLNAL